MEPLAGMTVGYLPGVFDMFHIGHLNILRNARPHVDWLIAGVVTDESVVRVKGVEPEQPLQERLQVVSAISLVDQAVVDDSQDKAEMWQRLGFDVIFKGDDWRGTAKGLRLEASMAAVGARVVYFPYTAGTSSTRLRLLLERRREGQGEGQPGRVRI